MVRGEALIVCVSDGLKYPSHCFRKRRGGKLSNKCMWCDPGRGRGADRDPKRKKIRQTRTRHAKKIPVPKNLDLKQLTEVYGWTDEAMLADLDAVVRSGICPYTLKRVKKLSEWSVDIIRRDEQPFWGTNARWVSKFANSKKGILTAEQWREREYFKKQWDKRQDELKINPYVGTMFESQPPPLRLVVG